MPATLALLVLELQLTTRSFYTSITANRLFEGRMEFCVQRWAARYFGFLWIILSSRLPFPATARLAIQVEETEKSDLERCIQLFQDTDKQKTSGALCADVSFDVWIPESCVCWGTRFRNWQMCDWVQGRVHSLVAEVYSGHGSSTWHWVVKEVVRYTYQRINI